MMLALKCNALMQIQQVNGPARILEVVQWFTKTGASDDFKGDDEDRCQTDSCSSGSGIWSTALEAASGLRVCRVKNKFGLRAEELVGGYRDVLLSVEFIGDEGLGIIGEIQVSLKI